MTRRIIRIAWRTVLIVVVLFIVTLLVFDRIVQFRMDDNEVKTWFAQKQVPASIHYYETHGVLHQTKQLFR